MDILYRLGTATAEEVQLQLPDPPGYSAVRAMLSKLEQKGHAKHRKKSHRYVYYPAVPKDKAKKSAVNHILNTFFNGSVEDAVAAFISERESGFSEEELKRLEQLIKSSNKPEKKR
jgi:predicted transcriptional regulator